MPGIEYSSRSSSMKRTDRKIHSKEDHAICDYFSVFVTWDYHDCYIFNSLPTFFPPFLPPSLPFLLLTFIFLFLKSKKADLLPFNFTSLGKHWINVIPYGKCFQHFCWYQSRVYSRNSSLLSLVFFFFSKLWHFHWLLKDFSLTARHVVKRPFRPGSSCDS